MEVRYTFTGFNPHAKPLVQTRCVCRMAASRQEKRSCAATEGASGKGDGGGSRADSLLSEPLGKPKNTEVGSVSLL